MRPLRQSTTCRCLDISEVGSLGLNRGPFQAPFGKPWPLPTGWVSLWDSSPSPAGHFSRSGATLDGSPKRAQVAARGQTSTQTPSHRQMSSGPRTLSPFEEQAFVSGLRRPKPTGTAEECVSPGFHIILQNLTSSSKSPEFLNVNDNRSPLF